AHRRAAQVRQAPRRGEPVHRRRRGDSNGFGIDLKRELQKLLDRSRFLRPWGFRVVKVKAGECTLELPHTPALERPGGIINGPALMAAADCAMWLAIKAKLGLEGDALTSDLNTSFLA